ncbi:MAG TPA: SdrD B-like domain-containing protein, partial [Longilinea sp.]|nr:SdrD B-like domain-containing protein [Longilinea sp.]
PDNSTILVEDMSYDVCYAVNEPPEDLGVTAASTSPIPGATAGTGAITGYVYADANANGIMDASEYGGGPYAITLADIGCSTTLSSTTTDGAGSYAFFSLPPGTYCVIMPYASSTILPGYWQRVTVVANNTTSAYFGMQPVAGPPPPPTTGYCGDGALDAGSGEQCDPPNLTDCTASCQTYTGYCGNGIVDPSLSEQCDPPNTTDCTASCQTYVGYCGNSIIDTFLGEQCDPPNITDCTASCQIYVAVCGDGWVDSANGEQCDPPNPDYCTASCQLYLPNCGNFSLDYGEECDPPNTTDCTAQCQSWP